MPKIYFNSAGEPSPIPFDHTTAVKERSKRYISLCPVCGGKVYFTKTKCCLQCSWLGANDLFFYATGGMRVILRDNQLWTLYDPAIKYAKARFVSPEYRDGLDAAAELFSGEVPVTQKRAVELGSDVWLTSEPCQIAGHFGVRTVEGKCYFCEQTKRSPRRDAIQAGKTWYTPTEPCKHCGQIAERNVHNGQCLGCRPDTKPISPRQAALRSGKTWYTPTEPCKHCGQIAEKNVNNGQCRGCAPPKRPAAIELPPDLIISRGDAKALGLKKYRTGRPCRRDHTGFRWVSTNNCIDCIKNC